MGAPMPASFVGVKLVEGSEVVGVVVADGALVLVEDEHVCADVEPEGEAADDVEVGLAGPAS